MSTKTKKEETAKGFIGETLKTVVIALGVALVLRIFLFQPFHIPSGSMEPNLYKGDYLITTKYSLGYGKYSFSPFPAPMKKGRLFERVPERGDIIVFKPQGSKVHFIKRLIGLPGDEVQMIDGLLYLNGKKLIVEKLADDTQADTGGNMMRFARYNEFFDGDDNPHMIFDKQIGSRYDNTGIFAVPAGHYFFMGDNRDNSLDSRVPIGIGGVSYVPASHLVGRAEFVLLSVGPEFKIYKPWTWGHLRGDRFFKGLR